MASSRWIPFSLLISPQGIPAGPRECIGKRPPRVMSPSILMDWGWVPCWAREAGLKPTSRTQSNRSHGLYPYDVPNQEHWWDERTSDIMMMTSRGTDSTGPLPLPLTPEGVKKRGVNIWLLLKLEHVEASHTLFSPVYLINYSFYGSTTSMKQSGLNF